MRKLRNLLKNLTSAVSREKVSSTPLSTKQLLLLAGTAVLEKHTSANSRMWIEDLNDYLEQENQAGWWVKLMKHNWSSESLSGMDEIIKDFETYREILTFMHSQLTLSTQENGTEPWLDKMQKRIHLSHSMVEQAEHHLRDVITERLLKNTGESLESKING